MRRMAYAKINWALAVTGTRADGYHLLDMLMQSVDLGDTLTFSASAELSLRVTGDVPVPESGDNLVLRAARLLREHADVADGAEIRLEKRIPAGAGLGGGSADAAATLLGLNDLWGLGLSAAELQPLALKLGADVPFCLVGGLARVRGIGEELSPLQPAPEIDLVVVKPERGLSTPAVFRRYDEMPRPVQATEISAAEDALLRRDLPLLAAVMGNDLEWAAMALLPEIEECRTALAEWGAVKAQMTGSGSAVIGVFESEEMAAGAAAKCRERWRQTYQIKSIASRPYT